MDRLSPLGVDMLDMMLSDVGLIDYIDMQQDISNKTSLSVLVLREAGATE